MMPGRQRASLRDQMNELRLKEKRSEVETMLELFI